jgi:pyruvate formate lyase activating enzyme
MAQIIIMKEALFYTKEEGSTVQCFLCNHHCRIKNDGLGICGVRKNINGKLYSLNYGELVAAGIDPIEKKPLFHFLPGSRSYSIACAGCNFSCDFCQNWQISQEKEARRRGVKKVGITASQVVENALAGGCPSISYTYTEPTIYFEFAWETAKLAKEKGLRNVFVTNGYMSREALCEIGPHLDAVNVDLKSFDDDFYKKICKARLEPVLGNIKLMKKLGIWVEITTLLIPGRNDSSQEISSIAYYIASVDKNIPWHISKFYPNYKLDDLASHDSVSVFEEAVEIGKSKGLKFIYIGNISSAEGENTYCPSCSKLLIKREGFGVRENNLLKGCCKICGEKIEGVWQ